MCFLYTFINFYDIFYAICMWLNVFLHQCATNAKKRPQSVMTAASPRNYAYFI